LDISVVLTLICRNEEINLKSNLALWLPVIDYFVFLMDDRNNDQSKAVIKDTLNQRAKYVITDYHFEGFGPARSMSLDTAWRYYPNASHVLIADPDWRPVISTLDKNHLKFEADVYRFTIFDRNGITTRQMDWLLRNKPNLRMRYHLHEVLDIGFYTGKSCSILSSVVDKPWYNMIHLTF
jgi:hypothetical protein